MRRVSFTAETLEIKPPRQETDNVSTKSNGLYQKEIRRLTGMLLDGTVSGQQIYDLIDMSYLATAPAER